MKKLIIGLVVGATMLAAPLGIASSAMAAPVAIAPPVVAEPRYDIWRCWYVREDPFTMSKYEYYGCQFGTIVITDSYTGAIKMRLDGYCANQLWSNDRSKTYQDAMNRCRI